jgi:hypothetical protein
MPINGYTRVVYRDDSAVIVHGFVTDNDEGTSRRHKVIIYSLERCCPVTAHSDDLLVSTPYACHIGIDYNFIRNLEGARDCEYWQHTEARPLEFRDEYLGRKSLNVLLATDEWCEISQRIPFRSYQRCRLSLGAHFVSFSRANTAYGQLRILLWQDGGVVDSAESLEVTDNSPERSYKSFVNWTPIETHLDIPDGSFYIEVILRAKGSESFECYLWNPTLKINYLS